MIYKQVIKYHFWRLLTTAFLIITESVLGLLFPIYIGYAIDDAILNLLNGSIKLGILGVITLIIGGLRRFYDSRFYAKIYIDLSINILNSINSEQVSKRIARLSMLREIVEFMENSFPALTNNIIGFIGVIVVIATLNWQIFIGSLIITFLVFILYLTSSRKTLFYNKNYNDEYENQVDLVGNEKNQLKPHLINLMKWNIKLSDLETLNFSISWVLLMAFLIYSIITAISNGVTQYGDLFALVMYIFQYIGYTINLPMFYQQWLRLKEIKNRLEKVYVTFGEYK